MSFPALGITLEAYLRSDGKVGIKEYPKLMTLPLKIQKVANLSSGGDGASKYDPATEQRCSQYEKRARSLASKKYTDKRIEADPDYGWMRLVDSVLVAYPVPNFIPGTVRFKKSLEEGLKSLSQGESSFEVLNPLEIEAVRIQIHSQDNSLFNLVGQKENVTQFFANLITNTSVFNQDEVGGELFARDLLCDLKEKRSLVELHLSGHINNSITGVREAYAGNIFLSGLEVPHE